MGLLQAALYKIRYFRSLFNCIYLIFSYAIYIQQKTPINLTTTLSISTVNHECAIVIALICSIALIGLIIVTVLVCFCCKLSQLESVLENSNSPKVRRVAKPKKKKVKEYSAAVVENKHFSLDNQDKIVHHYKLSSVSTQVQQSNVTPSKGTALGKSKRAVVAGSASPAMPSSKQVVLSKVNVVKACSSKQDFLKKKKVSSAVAPPPHRLDSRFGTMNSKLLLDLDIDYPSKSALDSSSNDSCDTGAFYSQNMSVGTVMRKRCSSSAKVTSKHQQKRHHKHKKTA